jgi:hypothetical protein
VDGGKSQRKNKFILRERKRPDLLGKTRENEGRKKRMAKGKTRENSPCERLPRLARYLA